MKVSIKLKPQLNLLMFNRSDSKPAKTIKTGQSNLKPPKRTATTQSHPNTKASSDRFYLLFEWGWSKY